MDKGDLLKLVYSDTIVEENAIAKNVSTLRKVLAGDPKVLERLPELTAQLPGAMNVWTVPWSTVMQLETKYVRLGTAVTLGSRFGDWRVCWLGGWSRHWLFCLVMLAQVRTLSCGATIPRDYRTAIVTTGLIWPAMAN
jgi:hypothetical protein